MSWLRNEIDRLFDGFDRSGNSLFNFAPTRAASALVPALDMTDAGKEYHLTVELPGMNEEDVDIEVADGILSISGEKTEEKESEQQGYLLSERSYGAFSRRIALPSDTDPDAINASFQQGVLSLSIGKDEASTSRKRKIAIGKRS